MPDSPSPKIERTCPRCGLVYFSDKIDAMCPACLISHTLESEDLDDGPAFWEDPPVKKAPPARTFSHFELLDELGRGGMGVVYRARDLNTERIVALKVLQAHHLDVPDLVLRFRSEVRAVSSLDHSYVLPIHEVGEYEGIPFFSMKLTTGGSLAQSLGNFRNKPREAAQLLAKVARGVQHAHERGILHRDLKPGNILLDAAGEPYVCDFGLAKWIEDDQKLTVTAAVLGTPHYIAPEQALGSKALTTAVDIYSLGAILYELLTGRPPFLGATVLETLVASQEKMPDRPSSIAKNVPADLETICLKALEHSPGSRYATAGAFADDLENWLAGRPINARPVNAAEQLWRWAKRNPLPALLVVALIGTLITIAIGSTLAALRIDQERLRATRAEAVAKEKLAQAKMAQAGVALVSGHAGQRLEALASIIEATEIHPSLEARNAAITALTLRDMEIKQRVPVRESSNQRLAYSADLESVVVAQTDGSLKVIDLTTGLTSRHYSGLGSHIIALAHGGVNYVASRNENGSIYLWDLRTGNVTEVFRNAPIEKWSLSGLSFDRSESALAFSDKDSGCYIINLGEPLEVKQVCAGNFSQVAFSPDTKWIAMLSTIAPFQLLLVNKSTGKTVSIPLAVRSNAVAWSPLGTTVAIGSNDGNIYVCEAGSGRLLATLLGHRQTISQVLFSHSGDLLVSTDQDQTTRLWDMNSLTESVMYTGDGMEPVMAFSPDDKTLAATDFYTNVLMFNLVGDPRICATFPGLDREKDWAPLVSSIDFSPDNKLLAVASFGGVQILDLKSMRRVGVIDADKDIEKNVRFDGQSNILVASRKSGVTRYSFSYFQKIFSITSSSIVYPATGYIFGSRTGFDSDHVALSSSTDGVIAIIDKKTGSEIKRIDGQPKVWDVVASPDLKWIAASFSAESTLGVRVWDQKGKLSPVELAAGPSGTLTVSPDFEMMVTTGQDGPRVWDTNHFENMPIAIPPAGRAAFSPDKKFLAICSDSHIEILDTRTFKPVATLQSRTQRLTSSYRLAFSPDGTKLVAQGYDNTLQIWSMVELRKSLSAIHLDWE